MKHLTTGCHDWPIWIKLYRTADNTLNSSVTLTACDVAIYYSLKMPAWIYTERCACLVHRGTCHQRGEFLLQEHSVLKPAWWHLVNYLNMHGRCLLKVSYAISARFILPYFHASSSLPVRFLFSCCFFYFSSLSKNLFFLLLLLLSMIAIPQSDIGDASNAIQSIGPIISLSVLTLCVHTTVRRKLAFYLVSVWQLFPSLSLKHLDLPSSYVFLSSRSDTQM